MLKEAIRHRALELGFDACRFTTAAPPATAAQFEHWLRDGRHGEMAYLQRNSHKRIDPQQVLPGARSIILLAASYHLEKYQPAETSEFPGVIARYARFRDYHDVLGESLRRLTEFIRQQTGPEHGAL